MATRGRTTFQKRQKELARKEKQRAKAERRAQRKAEAQNPGVHRPDDFDLEPDEAAEDAPETEETPNP